MSIRTMIPALLLLLTGCPSKATNDTAPTDTNTITGDAAAGKTVYSSTCAGCHPDITALGIAGSTDAQIGDIILNGTGSMPGQNLTDQEVADVIAYMHQQLD